MAAIVLILVFFVLAIIPVDASGNTRLYLLWLTLTGKTHGSWSTGTKTSAVGNLNTPQNTASASGDFGNTTSTTNTNTNPGVGRTGSGPTGGGGGIVQAKTVPVELNYGLNLPNFNPFEGLE